MDLDVLARMLRVLNDEDAEVFLVWLDAQDGSLAYDHFCQAYELRRPEVARKFFGDPPTPEQIVPVMIDLMDALKSSLAKHKKEKL